jgi:hypothetical protein
VRDADHPGRDRFAGVRHPEHHIHLLSHGVGYDGHRADLGPAPRPRHLVGPGADWIELGRRGGLHGDSFPHRRVVGVHVPRKGQRCDVRSHPGRSDTGRGDRASTTSTADPNAGPDSCADTDADPEADSCADPEADPEADTQADGRPESDAQADSQADEETGGQADNEADQETGGQTDACAERGRRGLDAGRVSNLDREPSHQRFATGRRWRDGRERRLERYRGRRLVDPRAVVRIARPGRRGIRDVPARRPSPSSAG